ncbi:MAG: hypothetical protein OXF68_15790 [Gammaproteobacteria bacterium]|nr:hypothetical protein [Gammaproteobacteria bacterium]
MGEADQASLFAALGAEVPPVADVPAREVRCQRREKRRDRAVISRPSESR